VLIQLNLAGNLTCARDQQKASKCGGAAVDGLN